MPVPVIAAAIVFAGCWVTLTQTRFGRYVYAIGGNENGDLALGRQRDGDEDRGIRECRGFSRRSPESF